MKLKFQKTITLLFNLSLILVNSTAVLAQGVEGDPGVGGSAIAPIPLPPSPTLNFPRTGLPAVILSAFLPAVIGILGFIAVYYMVLASIRLIISRGEPEKVAEARSRLIYAVVGFIVLLLAYASLQFIEQVFLKTNVAR